MNRVEPIVENAFARKPFVRMQALESAWEDWTKRPTRKNRDWARLLARSAAQDACDSVRNSAVEALAEFGTIADRRVLTAALDDEWDVTRASAVSALAKVVGAHAEREILRATKDRASLVRRYAWVALSDAIGGEAKARLEEAAAAEGDVEALVGIWAALLDLGHPDARGQLAAYAASGDRRIDSWAQDSLDQTDASERQSRS